MNASSAQSRSFLRLKHAASGGDIDAAALAKGAGESCVAEDFLKLYAGGTGGAGESAGGIERDEVDVASMPWRRSASRDAVSGESFLPAMRVHSKKMRLPVVLP